jgi:hypothetical protein
MQYGPIATPNIDLILEKASLEGIAELFDQYMCGAIRRDKVKSGGRTYWKAAITIVFLS